MIKHYCDKCGKVLEADEVVKMEIRCKHFFKRSANMFTRGFEYCEPCARDFIPAAVIDDEARLYAVGLERAKARREARERGESKI